MLLALLMLVAGLLGGPELLPALELGLGKDGGIPALWGRGGGAILVDTERGSGGGVPPMGGGVPLTDRGPPFGGGGVGFGASTCSAPGALLIHRLSSGS